ncbi:MAG: prepilin peptidase [Candidatus Paceibacterota bacterium]|jgi:leader peptidase (prepilin peptidase)/N-methyltransferase
MFALTFFLLGLIIGSFLNVVIYRYNTGRTLSGRSGCLSCGKKLHWYELFPVLSFVIQGGRCRGCRSRVSWQYPLVELITGLLFFVVFLRVGFSPILLPLYLTMSCLLVVITVYDLRHKIIPDGFVFTFIFLGLIKVLVSGDILLGIIGGVSTSLPLFFLWAISRGKWLGFGDVKLALGVGLILGWPLGLSALILSFWIGAVVGLFLIAWGKTQLWRKGKSYTMRSEIPFAPFIILGFWLVFLSSINVLFF